LPSQVVLAEDHRFLIDCGEGTQRQILKSGLGFKRLTRILLTHGHLITSWGWPGCFPPLRWETVEELEIWGGRRT
jgi:ribonuclease Z